MTPEQRAAHIRRLVDAAPALDGETRAQLRSLLGPTLRKHGRNNPR